MHILWVIIIGALAGFVAKLIAPSPNNPQGFILTTVLGIVGSIVASYLGQAVGLYGSDQGAGFIGAIVGAVIILALWQLQTNASADPTEQRPSVLDGMLATMLRSRTSSESSPWLRRQAAYRFCRSL